MRIDYSKHYEVTRNSYDGCIRNLYCLHCDFIVWRPLYKPATSHSGLGRFNVMRGEIVKHLHAAHSDLLKES